MSDTQEIEEKQKAPESSEEKRQRLVNEWRGRVGHHTGSLQFHRFGVMPTVVCTDGVLDMAKLFECFWFLDIIGTAQLELKKKPMEEIEFQIWHITVNRERTSGVVVCDTVGNTSDEEARAALEIKSTDIVWAYRQELTVNTFPLDYCKLYCQHNGEGWTIMLPGEY